MMRPRALLPRETSLELFVHVRGLPQFGLQLGGLLAVGHSAYISYVYVRVCKEILVNVAIARPSGATAPDLVSVIARHASALG
jgi:hypothetical protein